MYLLKSIRKVNLRNLANKLPKAEYYRQATRSKLLYAGTPSSGVVDQMDYPVIYLSHKEYEVFFSLEDFNHEATEFFVRSKTSRQPINNYYKRFIFYEKKILNIFQRLGKMDFATYHLEKLKSLMKRFDALYYRLWLNGFLCDKFDPEGDKMLKKTLSEKRIGINNEELGKLIRPRLLNFVERYRLALYKIALKQKNGHAIEGSLSRLAEKYYYLQNS